MKIQGIILGAAIAFALAVPAPAQQAENPVSGPLQISNNDRVPDLNAPKPTAQQLAAEQGAENPAVTSAAKRTYGQLAAGNLDRAKLTSDVSKALPATLLQSAAPKLEALGTPAWSFVGNAQSSAGDVSIYELKYAKGVAYMTFGVGNTGVVYALSLGAKPLAP